MRTLLFAAVLVALLAACAGAPAAPGAQGAADPELLYRTKCASCHRPYEPASRTRAEWATALGRMSRKAHLTPSEAETIGGFLASHAADARAGGAAP
jgi:mono/diheme cytochrome c family protein